MSIQDKKVELGRAFMDSDIFKTFDLKERLAILVSIDKIVTSLSNLGETDTLEKLDLDFILKGINKRGQNRAGKVHKYVMQLRDKEIALSMETDEGKEALRKSIMG